jgi:hypothetical protein
VVPLAFFAVLRETCISGVLKYESAGENMKMLILFIILILLALGSFGGGMRSTQYRAPGIGLGTVLLIVLVLWALGMFGTRPW